jgi:Flp pilus assembly protein TadB
MLVEAILGSVTLLLLAVIALAYRRARLHTVSVARMAKRRPEGEEGPVLLPRRVPSILRKYYFVPVAGAIVLALVLHFVFGVGWVFATLFGLITGILGIQIESFRINQRSLKVETQLADSIDLIVGALRSGAGLLGALESAAGEASRPLRPVLEEMVGRIRLGDNPSEVFQDLTLRVPLETFRLFSFSLAVHWEIGGSLAPTLATVGRTIRDRIDLSRRVKAQTMQARASVVAILLITYMITFVVWRTNPDRLEAFLSTTLGGSLMFASVLLQLLGLVWMSKLSKIDF